MGRRPNGASSIYRGSDGDWHGRVTVGAKADGKPDRRHVRGKTEAIVIRRGATTAQSRGVSTQRRALRTSPGTRTAQR